MRAPLDRPTSANAPYGFGSGAPRLMAPEANRATPHVRNPLTPGPGDYIAYEQLQHFEHGVGGGKAFGRPVFHAGPLRSPMHRQLRHEDRVTAKAFIGARGIPTNERQLEAAREELARLKPERNRRSVHHAEELGRAFSAARADADRYRKEHQRALLAMEREQLLHKGQRTNAVFGTLQTPRRPRSAPGLKPTVERSSGRWRSAQKEAELDAVAADAAAARVRAASRKRSIGPRPVETRALKLEEVALEAAAARERARPVPAGPPAVDIAKALRLAAVARNAARGRGRAVSRDRLEDLAFNQKRIGGTVTVWQCPTALPHELRAYGHDPNDPKAKMPYKPLSTTDVTEHYKVKPLEWTAPR